VIAERVGPSRKGGSLPPKSLRVLEGRVTSQKLCPHSSPRVLGIDVVVGCALLGKVEPSRCLAIALLYVEGIGKLGRDGGKSALVVDPLDGLPESISIRPSTRPLLFARA
jgi:hypothetical protein